VKKLTVTTYASVLLAEYNVNFLEKNIAKLEDNLTEVHQLFKNGFEDEESVEQIRLTLSSINSQLKYAKNFIKITEEILKFVIGYPLDQKLVLSSGVEDIFSEASLLTDKPDAVIIINNIDIQIAENKMKSDAILFKLEKSKSLPKLMAFINGTYTGNSNEFTFTENSQKWFGSSLVGVKLNIPIFSSLGRSANTQKAKITLEQAKTNLNEVQNRVQIEVNAALNNYQLAIENYFTEKENLRLAERIEKKNQTKYFEGMVSSFELRQAQLQLYTIQSSFLNSINNVITKKIELETLLNTPNP
jgi:outer membrane protein TolC